jgi:hypothetical protein
MLIWIFETKSMECTSALHQPDGVGSQGCHIGSDELNGVSIALVARFETEFNQQQTEMTNKIDNLLKALNNQALTTPRKDIKDPSSSKQVHFVNVVTIKSKDEDREESDKDEVGIETKPMDEIKKVEVKKEEELEEVEPIEKYFDKLPTKEEREYHKDLFDDPETPYILGSPLIKVGDPSNINIPCNIGHMHVWKAYIDPRSPINIMTRTYYNWVMKKQLNFRMMPNRNLISNFVGRVKGLHVIIGNLTYEIDFVIVEDTRPVIDACLSQVIFGKPFVEATRMSYDPTLGIVRFKEENNEIAYQMPSEQNHFFMRIM